MSAAERFETDLSDLSPREFRRLVARGGHDRTTAGVSAPYVQGNLAILPKAYAFDFLAFCQANPKPCPVVGMSAPGDPALPGLGAEIDIRTDVPRYNIYRNGELVDEVTDIRQHWRDDLVTFVLGCSYSFEEPMLAEGISIRHIEQGTTVPMFRTNIETTPSGPFRGPMVVSMRPMLPADAIRAVQITSRFPSVHGSPVHLAQPELIGVKDIGKPDWGDPVEIRDGEIPVFWACGVTPQVAIEAAKPDICITHKPGCMLVTDLLNRSLAVI